MLVVNPPEVVVVDDRRMPKGAVGVKVAAVNVPLVISGKNAVPVPVPNPVPKSTLTPVGATTIFGSEDVMAVAVSVPLSTTVMVVVVVLASPLSVDDRDNNPRVPVV